MAELKIKAVIGFSGNTSMTTFLFDSISSAQSKLTLIAFLIASLHSDMNHQAP